jgi:hypothetical protein
METPQPTAEEYGVSPETHASRSPYALNREASEGCTSGLTALFESHGIEARDRQRIQVWVKKGTELVKMSWNEIKAELPQHREAVYGGGIGMGISGNDSEFLDPEGKGEARVAVGDEWERGQRELLRKLGKVERGMPADFLAAKTIDMEVIFTIMPPENQKGLRASLRSDMLARKYLMEQLKQAGAGAEEWDWSNSGFKKAMVDRACKATLDLGVRTALRAGKLTVESTPEQVTAAFQWLRQTAPSNQAVFADVLEAWEYAQAYAGVDVYMGGAPDGRESLTYPIVASDHNLFRLAFKVLALKAQRKGVGMLGQWEETSPFVQALLEGKPLPASWQRRVMAVADRLKLSPNEGKLAMVYQIMMEGLPGDTSLMISRLAEMGRQGTWQEDEIMFPGEAGKLTERLWQSSRNEAVTTVLVDQKGSVVDASRGIGRWARGLWGEAHSMVVVTRPEVPYIDDQGRTVYSDLEHTAIKEVVEELRSWSALKKLTNLGYPVLVDKDPELGELICESHLQPAMWARKPTEPNESMNGMESYVLWAVDGRYVEELAKWRDGHREEQGQIPRHNFDKPVDKYWDLVNRALFIFDSGKAKFSTRGEDVGQGIIGDSGVDWAVYLFNALKLARSLPTQPYPGRYSTGVVLGK